MRTACLWPLATEWTRAGLQNGAVMLAPLNSGQLLSGAFPCACASMTAETLSGLDSVITTVKDAVMFPTNPFVNVFKTQCQEGETMLGLMMQGRVSEVTC